MTSSNDGDRDVAADKVTVAVLQFEAGLGDVEGNVDRLVQLIEKHGPGAHLVVAPELATTGYDLELLRDHAFDLAEPAGGPTASRIREVATRVGTTVVVGFLERDGDLVYDGLLTVTPAGAVGVYRKSHLYPPELAVFAVGESLGVVDTPAGVIGPMVCFDHAFPEVATTLALAGAQLLVIPSAVPLTYEHVLELRTRARAQDNQVFAIGCNMAGGGFCGRSLVADPRGEVLAQAGAAATVLVAELDLTATQDERSREPALRMRRPELYSVPSGE